MATLEAFCPVCQRTVHLGDEDAHVCPVCSSRLVGPALDEARAKRIGDNETLMREVNERIERLADGRVAYPEDRIAFVCECGDAECNTTIHLTRQDYEAVRAHPARLAIVPGHDIPSAEKVVEHNDGYDVVEKIGAARAEVMRNHPRT